MGLFGNIKEHTRDYPFRPPMRPFKDTGNDLPLYWRFIHRYAWPNRWSMLLCILIVAINSSFTYLMAYYTRMVVDKVLVVRTHQESETQHKAIEPIRNTETGSDYYARPAIGMSHRLDRPAELSTRPPEAGRYLFIIALFYMSTQIALNFMARLSTRQQIIVAQGISGSLREDLHEKILDLSMAYHQAMSPGRLLSRILSDAGAVRIEMMAFITSVTHCTSMLIVGVAILFYSDWRMALIAVGITPIYAYMYRKRRPMIRHLNQEIRHTNACLYGLATQKIDAIKAIQAYSRELAELLNFHRMIACTLRDSIMNQRLSSALGRCANILTGLSSCIIFLYGGKLVLEGEMTLGKMMFIHTTTMTLFQPVLEFTQLSFVLQRLRIALLRVASVLNQKIEITDAPNAVEFPVPMKKGVEIRNVFFHYPAATSSREVEGDTALDDAPPKLVLKGINLFIPTGEWLCIMGASGSGKSTLLHLLSRLYEPTAGDIIIDGVNLKDIKLLSLRHHLGVVPQEAQIFSGSMRDNICYGLPNASNEQIMDAAKAAQLHEFIMGMKVQYETLIGQKGSSLSGGQRQRLSLARALLTNPDLLVLDDCTSALDANTEQKIQETLSKILVGKTAIMVSQRVSMAMRCHKIAVLSDGVISEYGTHQELLEKNGFYAKLFHQQTE